MAKSSGKKIVKLVDKFVDFLVMLFLLSFFLYGGYSMWDTNRMYTRASPVAYEVYRPTREEAMGFAQLQAINSNVFGWISVFGTNIDYPLLQSNDNIRYVYTNAKGEPSRAGAIFLDFRNNQDLTDFNNIIYGHDMAGDAMFGEIANFQEEYFFDMRRFGMIFNGENYYGIEFFAFLLVDAYDSEIYNPTVANPELKEVILQRFLTEAIQYRELDVTIDDRLIVLSTCTPTLTNGRHLLVGRLTDEIPEDIFQGIRRGHGIDGIAGISELGLAIGSLFVIILTVGITLIVIKKKKKKLITLKEVPDEIKPVEVKRKPTTLLSDIVFLAGKITMIALSILLLFMFVFGIVQVDDLSMVPAMRDGDIVLFQRFGNNLIATDAVVVRYEKQTQIRRVIAVAGDTVDITDRGLLINGLAQHESHIFEETTQLPEGIDFPLVVPEGEVFVMGDARARSRDSRIYGTVPIDDILGAVVTVIRGWN